MLNCNDRMVTAGALPGACCARGMTAFLNAPRIRMLDYVRFAEPLRETLRAKARALATTRRDHRTHRQTPYSASRRKFREDDAGYGMAFRLTALLGDLFISSFAGLMTFYLCEASEIHGPLQAVLVGTSGHMRSRTIFILENYLNHWLAARFEKHVGEK